MRVSSRICVTALVVGSIGLGPGVVRADEGQWLPTQIDELDHARLARMGLELGPKDLWNSKGGVMRAAVNLNGCSASFVSDKGLIVTNHHCAYRAIQSISSAEDNKLEKGFLARRQANEARSPGYTAKVVRAIRDVTKPMRAAIDGAKDDVGRERAMRAERKRLEEECEKKAEGVRCSVAGHFRGGKWELTEYLELRDIRLVYAPPAAIGEYGGDIDNWMWPRHTGDFSFFRAYVSPDGKPAEAADENVPYVPKHHLKVGANGVRGGDFVAVLGFPGRTRRYLSAVEAERYVERDFPAVVSLYGAWLDDLDRAGATGAEASVRVAAQKKSLANRHKNARGMLRGLKRMRYVDKRAAEEKKLREGDPKAAKLLDELSKLSQERTDAFERNFLLDSVKYGPRLLGVAVDLVRRARERERPDAERAPRYAEREARNLRSATVRKAENYVNDADARMLARMVERARELPEKLALPALAKLGGTATGEALVKKLRALVGRSQLDDVERVGKLFDAADRKALESSADPMLKLAAQLAPAYEELTEAREQRSGATLRLGPQYFELLRKSRTGAVYPDANGTLRFSYATVKGYSPEDALEARPVTKLAGAVTKHTGDEPFALPDRVLDKAKAAKDSFWSDPVVGDVPLCFLSTADTTGGNSGSPVINGKGELVGLNFDRVWENIAGDFAYRPKVSRNISVDIRYALWLLDRVEDATELLEELNVAKYRSRGARGLGKGRPRARPAKDDTHKPGEDECGCRVPGGDGSGGGGALVAAALGAAWLRRRR